ncbi:hypothetical protein [Endozoicomonas numazuensis]|uniref:Uncharacterized protein n=1 Tax=Endozoicomonas numazuensis TaxID=1137799 RepID=A0A081NF47_9GAMM|nr:hypothetical protein [Endozoicomonas numazuensis]KEQ17070.1 hypothetical protein GZ78_14350 [Endozoicomonas numazuensis]
MDNNNLDENSKMLIELAESHAAIVDMLTIICHQLAKDHTQSASAIHSLLSKLKDESKIESTEAFQLLSDRLLLALEDSPDSSYLSLTKSDQDSSGRDKLKAALSLIRGGKS